MCETCGLPFATFDRTARIGADLRPEDASPLIGDAFPLGVEAAGAPANDSLAGRRCGRCRSHPPLFSYARAAAPFGDVVREALHSFKFGGRRAVARPLGDLLAEASVAGTPAREAEILVPVPLHRRRQRERGFNQAALLADRLGCRWGIAVADAMRRPAATPPQSGLSAEARRQNVRDAFAVARPRRVAGRHVLLVDDVMTTGATAEACAVALRRAGAAMVGILTVARAL